MSESEREAAFRANPLIRGFLSTALEDLQFNENETACQEEREARDTGTIYDCPDETFQRAKDECEAFLASARAAPELIECGFTLAEFIESSFPFVREHIGSDLYLERAGHGAGFRDRTIWADGYTENREIGERLSAAVNPRGTLEIYLGDDGCAYFV